MVYFDIHTHCPAVHHEDIAIISLDLRDREKVAAILSVDTNLAEKPDSGLIKTNIRSEYYSVGVHPWYPDRSLMAQACEYATSPLVVAIGETGLDKNTANSIGDFKQQQELFEEHIVLSEKVGKPLIIHCVKAWDELLHIHKSAKPSMPWIIHGFRGKATLAGQLMDAGLYLSFSTQHNVDSLKTAWEKRRLLVETDDTNTDIRDIYVQIASNLNITIEELSDNILFFSLFALKQKQSF